MLLNFIPLLILLAGNLSSQFNRILKFLKETTIRTNHLSHYGFPNVFLLPPKEKIFIFVFKFMALLVEYQLLKDLFFSGGQSQGEFGQ